MDSCVARQFRDAKEVFIELLTEYGENDLGNDLSNDACAQLAGSIIIAAALQEVAGST